MHGVVFGSSTRDDALGQRKLKEAGGVGPGSYVSAIPAIGKTVCLPITDELQQLWVIVHCFV